MMKKKRVDVAVIIPDAGPILTLTRVDRLDLLGTFVAPIHIVDQVYYEVTKPRNDPVGRAAAWLKRMHNQIVIVETMVGLGFKTALSRGQNPAGGNLGEIAIDEYASRLALTGSPTFVPLVLFEDPDVLKTRIASLDRVHLLNTAAWIRALADESVLEDAASLIKAINEERKTPLDPYERPGQTRRVRSRWFHKKGGRRDSR